MSTRSTVILSLSLLLLVAAVSAAAFPALPDQVASHWDAAGQVNGYMPKTDDLLLLPGIMAALVALLFLMPLIDPLGKNIAAFRPQYNLAVLCLCLMLAIVRGITLAWNLGFRFPMGVLLSLVIAVCFYFLGAILPHAKRNWTFGIRTPWTLSSDVVWEKTHRLGSWLFRASAVVILASAFFPDWVLTILLADMSILVVWVVAYSYWEYRKGEGSAAGK
ncbi:MAG: SdpI family protein [Anaerolineales bacterium]